MRFKTSPRKAYSSDLTNDQWNVLGPLLSPPCTDGLGRPREVDLREVINAILYLNRTGCQWDMLPHDLLPKEHGLLIAVLITAAGVDDGAAAPQLLAQLSTGSRRPVVGYWRSSNGATMSKGSWCFLEGGLWNELLGGSVVAAG